MKGKKREKSKHSNGKIFGVPPWFLQVNFSFVRVRSRGKKDARTEGRTFFASGAAFRGKKRGGVKKGTLRLENFAGDPDGVQAWVDRASAMRDEYWD